MKCLLLTLEYPPFHGGVANYYGNLVKYWPEADKIAVINQTSGHWLTAWPKLRRALRQDPTTFVLIGQILPLGTVAWLQYLIKPFSYGVFLHGMDLTFALKTPRKKKLAALILSRSRKIICANSYVAQLVKEFQPDAAAKIIIANPGIAKVPDKQTAINTAALAEKYHTAGRFVILSLGRLVLRKGVDTMIKALALLDKTDQEKIAYLVAGTGKADAQLKDLAKQEKVAVTFLGAIDDPEKWQLLNLCDILAMPARAIGDDFEGFGIVYLEANLCGKAVIAGRSGGIPDAVVDQKTGLLVNPEDPTAVKEAIKYLQDHPDVRQQWGQNGRARALADFTWDKQIKKIYDNLN